jgi:hypothetical protein
MFCDLVGSTDIAARLDAESHAALKAPAGSTREALNCAQR